MTDRTKFFATVKTLHAGHLTQSQVDGYTALLDAWEQKYDHEDIRFLAYCLATAFHETAATMQPIKERGSQAYLSKYDVGALAKALGNTIAKDGDGERLAGRGYVMLTGTRNYRVAGQMLSLDLLDHPDLALDPHVAAQVLYSGCLQGWFTGKKLKDFLVGGVFQPVNARRVVNGTDCAVKIMGYYNVMLKAVS